MNETTMYNAIPVVSELNRVKGFDPTRFLRKTKDGPKLDLSIKKLWFRLKYPNGRIKLSALKITDQLAIIEARVYFDKNDSTPVSSFVSQRENKTTPGGLYIEMAQHSAIDEALSSAGFGIQFIPANADKRISQENSVKVEKAVEAPTVVEKAETVTKVEEAPQVVDAPIAENTTANVDQATVTDVVSETTDTAPEAVILAAALRADGVPFCRIDGSTRERSRECERFNNSPEIPVFLISLKAGGLGLNITGADTVLHYDPWWNPAAEAQATDRAHRIGQRKTVSVIKLAIADSVEERVLLLQREKRLLLEELFEASEAGNAKISLAELKDLMR